MNAENVLKGKRLEIQLIRGVIVGGNRFGIAVDDYRLKAQLFQGKRRMNAAVVEFDALPYSVRAAAENHYLRSVAYRAFVLFKMIGGVVISRILCAAYMNALPRFLYAIAKTCVSDLLLGYFKNLAEVSVGEAVQLCLIKHVL